MILIIDIDHNTSALGSLGREFVCVYVCVCVCVINLPSILYVWLIIIDRQPSFGCCQVFPTPVYRYDAYINHYDMGCISFKRQ